MLAQFYSSYCPHCQRATNFQLIKIYNVAGVRCLNCNKRWVFHQCNEKHSREHLELLPLLADFGINAAYDAFCRGCRQQIYLIKTAADTLRPYNPKAAEALDTLAAGMKIAMVVVTVIGIVKWLDRNLS